MIPKRFIRSVPAKTTEQVESFWLRLQELHPGWEFDTYRDPIDPTDFPITSPHWHQCTSGAQLAGLVRLEAMYHGGGIWIDSDVEPFRSFEPLLQLQAFAAWEDRNVIPDAVLGFEQHHMALTAMIGDAISRLPEGAWASGPGVTNSHLRNRPDVLLLPPAVFYPVHYTNKATLDAFNPDENPWTYGMHRWAASWPGSYQG